MRQAGEPLQLVAVNGAFRYRLEEAAKPCGAKIYFKHQLKTEATALHWKNFLHCVRTREKPVSDVEFALKVQAALNMSMLAFLNRKVAGFDATARKILI